MKNNKIRLAGWFIFLALAPLLLTGISQAAGEADHVRLTAAATMVKTGVPLQVDIELLSELQARVADNTYVTIRIIRLDGFSPDAVFTHTTLANHTGLGGTLISGNLSSFGAASVTVTGGLIEDLRIVGTGSGLPNVMPNISVDVSIINSAPTISIIEPDGITDITGTTYQVLWEADDPDNDARVSLFYKLADSAPDSGSSLIVANLSENDISSYTWNVSNVLDGDYIIRGTISDNINPQVEAFSPGVVTVTHIPAPPSNLAAAPREAGRIHLTWDASSAFDINQYNIYLSDDGNEIDYSSVLASVNSSVTEFLTDPFPNNALLKFGVRAVDISGKEEPNENVTAQIRADALPPAFSSWNTPVDLKDFSTVPFTVQVRIIDSANPVTVSPVLEYSVGNQNYDQSITLTSITSLSGFWEGDIVETWSEHPGETLYYRATAVDGAGNEGTSTTRTELIEDINSLPTVTISPVGTWIKGITTISADAQDIDGTITRVDFEYRIGTGVWVPIGSVFSEPFDLALDTAAVFPPVQTNLRLRASATDDRGDTTISGSVSTSVDNSIPRLVLLTISPEDITGETTGNIRAALNLQDEGSGIKSTPVFEYKIGNDDYSQINFEGSGTSWVAIIPELPGGWDSRAGEYMVYRVSFSDLAGNTDSSVLEWEFIDGSNDTPVTEIVDNFREWVHLTQDIIINASDPDGEIREVSCFYSLNKGDSWVQIGSSLMSGPFIFSFNTAAAGIEELEDIWLQGRAVDNRDLLGFSDVVVINIDNKPPSEPVIAESDQVVDSFSFTLTLTSPSTDLNFDKYQVRGGHYADWTTTNETESFFFELNQNEANVLEVRGCDLAENFGQPASIIIIEDSTAPLDPQITIVNKPYAMTTAIEVTMSVEMATEMYFDGDLADGPDVRTYIPFAESYNLTLSDGDGLKTVSVKFKDSLGRESETVSDFTTLDTTFPDDPVISIRDGERTSLLNITVDLSVSNADEMFIDGDIEDAASVRGWVPVESELALVMTSGDAEKQVTARYRDEAGNIAGPVSDSIVLDQTAPNDASFVISEGEQTNQTTVNLALTNSDAAEMFITGNVEDDVNTFEWIPAAESVAVTLAGEDGTKTVAIRWRDDLLNTTDPLVKNIVLDTSGPANTEINIAQGVKTADPEINLLLSADGAVDMQITGDVVDDENTFDFIDYAEALTVTLTEGFDFKTVSVVYRDELGNMSDMVSVEIELIRPPDINKVVAAPNPFYPSRDAEVIFFYMPDETEIKIYNIAGDLVYRASRSENMKKWDGRNNSGRMCASGVYIYVLNKEGHRKKGKIAMIK